MLVFALNPNLEAQGQAIPWLAINILPTWLAAVIPDKLCNRSLPQEVIIGEKHEYRS